LLDPFERSWYKHGDRQSKNRLGKLYYSQIKIQNNISKSNSKDNSSDHVKKRVARYIDLPRISVFIIEKFENRMI